MTVVHLDEPRVIWHVHGPFACNGPALLGLAVCDPTDVFSSNTLRHTDGSPVRPLDAAKCDHCGGLLSVNHFAQLLRGAEPPVDPFRAAMTLAVLRVRGRLPEAPATP